VSINIGIAHPIARPALENIMTCMPGSPDPRSRHRNSPKSQAVARFSVCRMIHYEAFGSQALSHALRQVQIVLAQENTYGDLTTART
jgi:hypothetical protein